MKYLKYYESINNELDISNMKLSKIGDYLEYFLCDSITIIKMYDNNIRTILILPNNLKQLIASDNKLYKLPELPETLEGLYVPRNKLSKLPKLPNKLLTLSCGRNSLEELPELPNSLLYLYCENNKLSELPFLPDSLLELHVGSNNWNKPIPYDLIKKYNLTGQRIKLYTKKQDEKFGSYEYQKNFLTTNPEKYKDLEYFGFPDEIKEEFDWLFNAADMGLI